MGKRSCDVIKASRKQGPKAQVGIPSCGWGRDNWESVLSLWSLVVTDAGGCLADAINVDWKGSRIMVEVASKADDVHRFA